MRFSIDFSHRSKTLYTPCTFEKLREFVMKASAICNTIENVIEEMNTLYMKNISDRMRRPLYLAEKHVETFFCPWRNLENSNLLPSNNFSAP